MANRNLKVHLGKCKSKQKYHMWGCILFKRQDTASVEKDMEMRKPLHNVSGAIMDSSTEIAQNTKNENSIWFSFSTFEIYLKNTKTPAPFYFSIFTIGESWKQHKCPTEDKEMSYITMKNSTTIKRWNPAITWLSL